MMGERREYCLTIRLVSPFLFEGTTNTIIGVDSAFLRDADGRPVIPAAQVRGVLRAAMAALRDAGYQTADIEGMFGHASKDARDNNDLHDVPDRGHAIFGDLVAAKPSRATEYTRVAIDEATGTVKRGALQVIELVAPLGDTVDFSGKLVIRYPDPVQAAKVEAAIRKALRLIPAMGAHKSAGFGEVVTAGCSLVETGKHEALAPTATAPLPPGTNLVAFDVAFDRPLLVDARRAAENVFEGSTVVPGAALKGAVAERLRLAGLRPETDPRLSSALAATRFSHAFPLKDGKAAELPLPMSLVLKGETDLADIAGWSMGQAPLHRGKAADFLASAKDERKIAAREKLGLPLVNADKLPRTHIAIDNDRLTAAENQLYSTVAIATQGHLWRMTLDFSAVDDREQAALIRAAVSGTIDGIGRTGATATLTEVDVPKFPEAGSEAILTLVTPALLFDGASDKGKTMAQRYAEYFQHHLDGAVLENFFARRRMAGGYAATRYRAYGPAYFPFVLTEPGSVFRLSLKTPEARAAVTRSLRFGLPAADLGGVSTNWQSCPYVPENGYGEVRLDLAGSLGAQGLEPTEADDVR